MPVRARLTSDHGCRAGLSGTVVLARVRKARAPLLPVDLGGSVVINELDVDVPTGHIRSWKRSARARLAGHASRTVSCTDAAAAAVGSEAVDDEHTDDDVGE